MGEWYFFLAPVAVLAALLLFRFIGCDTVFGLDDMTYDHTYPQGVLSDGPASYWRLQEKPPPMTSPPTPLPPAKDEMGLAPGTYGQAPSPIAADSPHRSPEASPIILELGVTTPQLLLTDTSASALKVQGGFVQVTVPLGSPLNSPEFTVEALVLPDPTLVQTLGRYHCLIESSDPGTPQPTVQQKKLGYAIYAGPDDPTQPQSPYHWQLWVGTGTEFQRVKEITPYNPPKNEKNEPNPGPQVVIEPTYLAVTYDGSTFLLYMYRPGSDVLFVKYQLQAPTPASYAANAGGGDLFIGIVGNRRALFPPFPGPNRFLYPFWGEIEEVAVYGKALTEERIMSHMHAALGL